MNSVTAVLLALGLILVVLLVVWLVLRSRTSDVSRASPSHAPGPAADEASPHQGQEPGPRDAETPGAQTYDATPVPDVSLADRTNDAGEAERAQLDADEADATMAEEFVAPGASALDAGLADEAEPDDVQPGDVQPDDVQPDDENIGDAGSEPPPRTPTEAFGSAYASGESSDHDAASHQTSVLDDKDADSTPLFRSIREELLGSTPSEEAVEKEPAAQAQEAFVEEALIEEVVSEQPEVEESWSHERRAWDAQAHAENEGVVETGVVGPGSVGPAAEEEKVLETNEETIGDVHVTPEVMMGEHPPIRRISELQEVVDGGFGIGSAATLDDGAQPLGHPIKASRDTRTYQDLHSRSYDETEPDVWFLDAGFAERAGFRRAE